MSESAHQFVISRQQVGIALVSKIGTHDTDLEQPAICIERIGIPQRLNQRADNAQQSAISGGLGPVHPMSLSSDAHGARHDR